MAKMNIGAVQAISSESSHVMDVGAVQRIESGGGDVISGSFDEASITSWSGTLVEGEVVAGSFNEASVTSWQGSVVEGEIVPGSFTEAPITSWSGTLVEGTGTAEVISGSFDEVGITSFQGAIVEGEIISGTFTDVPITSWAGTLSEGKLAESVVIAGTFHSVPVYVWPGTIVKPYQAPSKPDWSTIPSWAKVGKANLIPKQYEEVATIKTLSFSCNTCGNPFTVEAKVQPEGETVNKTAKIISGSCGLSPSCKNKNSINQALDMSRNSHDT